MQITPEIVERFKDGQVKITTSKSEVFCGKIETIAFTDSGGGPTLAIKLSWIAKNESYAKRPKESEKWVKLQDPALLDILIVLKDFKASPIGQRRIMLAGKARPTYYLYPLTAPSLGPAITARMKE